MKTFLPEVQGLGPDLQGTEGLLFTLFTHFAGYFFPMRTWASAILSREEYHGSKSTSAAQCTGMDSEDSSATQTPGLELWVPENL